MLQSRIIFHFVTMSDLGSKKSDRIKSVIPHCGRKMASKLQPKYLFRVGRIRTFWYLQRKKQQHGSYLWEKECMVQLPQLLSLATWTPRPHFFLPKKQVGTWKVCSMSWKGSSELCPGLQPALKSEPSGLVEFPPPHPSFQILVHPEPFQSTLVWRQRSPTPKKNPFSK